MDSYLLNYDLRLFSSVEISKAPNCCQMFEPQTGQTLKILK